MKQVLHSDEAVCLVERVSPSLLVASFKVRVSVEVAHTALTAVSRVQTGRLTDQTPTCSQCAAIHWRWSSWEQFALASLLAC